ncbi:MAG: hypothetical protein EXQ90_04910 [Rhodospirillales bacterium]|nr:hypothetical protein [Rhodospirillales bacterium]
MCPCTGDHDGRRHWPADHHYLRSYPAVIFSGDLAAHLPLGIGAALVSAIVLGVVIVLFVAYPAVIPYAQFEPNVVIAVIVATAATTLTDAGRGDAILPTIIILMPLCTLLIGNLIRYAPFPVIAWLLAGVGWFLIRAAFSSAAGRPLEWDTIGSFWEPATIVRWLPALVGGLVLWGLQRRRSHYMNMPAMLA